ncbi:hypothetical protein CS542_10815 [Pedobacter sp. IW39]|nr:hypothetical protein CS542_10815 [Pedobacter sp. IW39]
MVWWRYYYCTGSGQAGTQPISLMLFDEMLFWRHLMKQAVLRGWNNAVTKRGSNTFNGFYTYGKNENLVEKS